MRQTSCILQGFFSFFLLDEFSFKVINNGDDIVGEGEGGWDRRSFIRGVFAPRPISFIQFLTEKEPHIVVHFREYVNPGWTI